MHIHLTPRYLNNYQDVEVKLVDFSIPSLGVHFCEGKELVARKPYPNKCYLVACRKKGNKAMDGIILSIDKWQEKIAVITRWAVNAEIIAEHIVHYDVLDKEFNAISDDPVNWYGLHKSKYKNRFPRGLYPDLAPVSIHPRLEVQRNPDSKYKKSVVDKRLSNGIIVQRVENLSVPSVEFGRLLEINMHNRIPPLCDEFCVTEQKCKKSS
jgi:hypothetical protein